MPAQSARVPIHRNQIFLPDFSGFAAFEQEIIDIQIYPLNAFRIVNGQDVDVEFGAFDNLLIRRRAQRSRLGGDRAWDEVSASFSPDCKRSDS